MTSMFQAARQRLKEAADFAGVFNDIFETPESSERHSRDETSRAYG